MPPTHRPQRLDHSVGEAPAGDKQAVGWATRPKTGVRTEVTLCTPLTVAKKETFYTGYRIGASTSGATSLAAARSRWLATAARAIELARTHLHACMRQLQRAARSCECDVTCGARCQSRIRFPEIKGWIVLRQSADSPNCEGHSLQ